MWWNVCPVKLQGFFSNFPILFLLGEIEIFFPFIFEVMNSLIVMENL
jgi:hypothetical protein